MNLAVNNITKVQGLQQCESLTKLDLTLNFIDKQGLLNIASLQRNASLTDLTLVGNPCEGWAHYRSYVIINIPSLMKLVSSYATDSTESQSIPCQYLMLVLLQMPQLDCICFSLVSPFAAFAFIRT